MSEYKQTYEAMLDYIGADAIESIIVNEKGLTKKNGKYSCCMHNHKNPYKMTFHRESKSFRCHDEESFYGLGNLYRDRGLNSKEILEAIDSEYCGGKFTGNHTKAVSATSQPKKEEQVKTAKDTAYKTTKIKRISEEGDKTGAIAWLRDKRGIQAEIEQNMPIVTLDGDIHYIYYDVCGNVVRIKHRKEGKKFLTTSIEDEKIYRMPYNIENCKDYSSPLYIVEGEQDALALYSIGYQAVTMGSSSDTDLATMKNVYEELSKYHKLVEFMDDDEKGKKAAARIKEILPNILTVKKELLDGCKDANELLQTKGKEALHKIAGAIVIDDNIVRVREIQQTKKKEKVVKTIFEDLNGYINGWYRGQVNVIGGASGSGKTTFVNQAVILSSLLAGEKVFWYNAEFDNEIGLSNLLQSITKDQLDLETELKGVIRGKRQYIYRLKDEAMERLKRTVENKLVMFKDGISNDPGKVFKAVEKLARLEGARVVVLDNLMCLRDYHIENDNNAVTELILNLKRLATELGLMIFVVAHTKKGQRGSEGQESLSGTSNIGNLSDTVMIVTRDLTEEEKNNYYIDAGITKAQTTAEKPKNAMKLIIDKNRLDGATGHVEFLFNPKTRRFDVGDGETFGADYEKLLNRVGMNDYKFKAYEIEEEMKIEEDVF